MFFLFFSFSGASDESGPEGKNHLHTRYGLWSDRPPRSHPPERHAYIRRGTAQAGVIAGVEREG